MALSSLIGVAFVILLLVPGATAVSTVGISSGDSVTYAYQYVTTYKIPPSGNYTSVTKYQFTLGIDSVNATQGVVEYSITVSEANNTLVATQTAATNFTTIFNPYDNESYLGHIGFYPFIYTDVQPGTKPDLRITLPLNGVPGINGSVSGGTRLINATVMKTPEAINVNFTIFNIPHTNPILTILTYNATTGLLYSWKEDVYTLGIEKIFSYQLLSFSQPSRPNLIIFLYAGLAVVAFIIVYSVATRGNRQERKVSRIRKKFERPG